MPIKINMLFQKANWILRFIIYTALYSLLLTFLSASIFSVNAQDRQQAFAEQLGMSFVQVPPGTYSARLCPSCRNQIVVISKPFEMSIHEITQAQWISLMGTAPWLGKGDETRHGAFFPATYVSWNDIQKFLSKLNALDDLYIYSLPSSAQWEHACRAGSQDIYSFGDDSTALKAFAWYHFNTVKQDRAFPHQVGQKLPNKWGIYDLHGNVAEWVSDHKITGEVIGTGGVISNPTTIASDADQRVARGSYFYQHAKFAGVESYFEFSPDMKHAGLGFRLIRKPTIKRSNLDD